VRQVEGGQLLQVEQFRRYAAVLQLVVPQVEGTQAGQLRQLAEDLLQAIVIQRQVLKRLIL